MDGRKAQRKSAITARWAVTMTKWHIRRVNARPRWQLVTFCGPKGAEAARVVDMLALRKAFREQHSGMKSGDAFQLVIIQVKGGSAAKPTEEDANRLRAVARRHRARAVLYIAWKKADSIRFFRLRRRKILRRSDWDKVTDLNPIFR